MSTMVFYKTNAGSGLQCFNVLTAVSMSLEFKQINESERDRLNPEAE